MGHSFRVDRWGIGAAGVALALSVALGGCAAAVVVPVLAAGTMVARNSKDDGGADLLAPVSATETAEPATKMTLVDPSYFEAGSSGRPPIANPSGPEEWRRFVDYALGKSRTLGGPEPVQSALLITGSRLEWPDRLPCRSPTPAVVVDLDQGASAFSPAPSSLPAAGLAEGLAQLRAAGVVVMWVSEADANRVTAIGDALRSSGLDAAGKDPLLLIRSGEERKQVMRDDANKSVCIVAMAGDRRSDFDELFDYLRDPSSAAGLDAMLGDGWFIVPPPLGEAPAPAN